MIQIKSIVLLLILTVYVLNINAKGAKNMLQNKPFLTVHLNTSNCTHEVRINDVPLLPESGRSVGVDIVTVPVNHWVQSGENELSVKIFPMPNEDNITRASVEITLKVKPFDDNNPEKNNTIATLTYQGSSGDDEEKKVENSSESGRFDVKNKLIKDEKGSVIVSDIVISKIKEDDIEGIRISRKVTVPLPFPKWKWLSGDLIEDNENTKLDLYKIYYKIYSDIKSKNFDLIYTMFNEYKEEHVIAMYNPSLKEEPSYIADNANNPELELTELDSNGYKYSKLLVFGNQKLAKIVLTGYYPLIGYNIKNGGSIDHDFIFRKEGNKWIFCR